VSERPTAHQERKRRIEIGVGGVSAALFVGLVVVIVIYLLVR
jgi:hypothetical protein